MWFVSLQSAVDSRVLGVHSFLPLKPPFAIRVRTPETCSSSRKAWSFLASTMAFSPTASLHGEDSWTDSYCDPVTVHCDRWGFSQGFNSPGSATSPSVDGDATSPRADERREPSRCAATQLGQLGGECASSNIAPPADAPCSLALPSAGPAARSGGHHGLSGSTLSLAPGQQPLPLQVHRAVELAPPTPSKCPLIAPLPTGPLRSSTPAAVETRHTEEGKHRQGGFKRVRAHGVSGVRVGRQGGAGAESQHHTPVMAGAAAEAPFFSLTPTPQAKHRRQGDATLAASDKAVWPHPEAIGGAEKQTPSMSVYEQRRDALEGPHPISTVLPSRMSTGHEPERLSPTSRCAVASAKTDAGIPKGAQSTEGGAASKEGEEEKERTSREGCMRFEGAASAAETQGQVLAMPELTCSREQALSAAFAEDVLSKPIVLLRGFLAPACCGVPEEPFTLQALQAQHGDVVVDVLQQDTAALRGWNLPMQESYKMPLKDYIKYTLACAKGKGPALSVDDEAQTDPSTPPPPVTFVTNPNTCQLYQGLRARADAMKLRKEYSRRYKRAMRVPAHPSGFKDRITSAAAQELGLLDGPKPTVQYAVNCDMVGDEWAAECTALFQGLPEWMHACGPADAFALTPQRVAGMNAPQMYIKVAGSSTAAHEENNRFYSVNHNHGPGESEWGAIAPQHVARLRAVVLQQAGIDIYAAEGRYIPDEALCAAHGIPIMRGRQRAGDTVVLAGGTIHWVKALGPAVHTSWNYAPFRPATFAAAIARRNINASMRPVYPSYVPMTSLCRAVAQHLICSKPLLGLTSRSIDRLLLHAAGATHGTEARTSRDEEQVMDVLSTPGACATLPDLLRLLRILHEELCSAHRHSEAEMGALLGAGLTLEKEPSGSAVFRCQQPGCSAEIYNAYVVCETCLGIGSSSIASACPKASCGKKQKEAAAFFVTPPPGRTDVQEELQAKICVPSLLSLEVAKHLACRRSEAGIPRLAVSVSRLERRRRRRRAWRDGVLSETGQLTCAPIMCTSCGLAHRIATGGSHRQLSGLYKFSASSQAALLKRLDTLISLLSTALES